MNTIITIPGRETQTVSGFSMSKEDVIASYAGTIDLSSLEANESTNDNGDTVITFSNRTGTKGQDVSVNIENLNVSGDLVVNATRIEIPGRETSTIPNMNMSVQDVVSAFAGTMDLSRYESNESLEGDVKVVRFSTRTGTKGAGQISIEDVFRTVVNAATTTAAPQVNSEADTVPQVDADEDVALELTNTRIVIPGRESQFIRGMVLDAQQVRNSFAGQIDLSNYDVEEIDQDDGTLEVRFTARTGTKG